MTSVRERVLSAAKDAVCGDCARNYGAPETNFERIARLWTDHLRNTGKFDLINPLDYISATDVALMLLLMKVARLANNPAHEDSWVDIAGYAACGAECATLRGAQGRSDA